LTPAGAIPVAALRAPVWLSRSGKSRARPPFGAWENSSLNSPLRRQYRPIHECLPNSLRFVQDSAGIGSEIALRLSWHLQ